MSVSHHQLFAVALVFSTTAFAQDQNVAPAKETTDKISKYDNMCFHCIDTGNLFCATDATAKEGKCLAALCEEQEDLKGEAKKAAKGKCTLKSHACYDGTPMITYSECMPSWERDAAKCPPTIQITQGQIASGGKEYTDENGEKAYEMFAQPIVVDKKDVCITDITMPVQSMSSKPIDGDKKGSWGLTEWEDNLYVMMTKLEDGAVWDASNSGLFSAETYYYSRDSDDGNIAGRIPLSSGNAWRVLILNYNTEGEESVVVEYGAATAGIVATTLGLAASALALLM